MKRLFITLVIESFLFFGVINANATVVTTADGIYSYEWLEFNNTVHMTREEVETTLLGSGQLFGGYRYATRLETELLLDSYYSGGSGDLHNDTMDIGLTSETWDAANAFFNDFGGFWDSVYDEDYDVTWNERAAFFYYGSEDELEQFLQPGHTYSGSVYERNSEEYANLNDTDPIYEGLFLYNRGTDASSTGYNIKKNEFDGNGFDNIDMSMSLLVKSSASPVPEPNSILLFSVGIFGLFVRKIKKRNNAVHHYLTKV